MMGKMMEKMKKQMPSLRKGMEKRTAHKSQGKRPEPHLIIHHKKKSLKQEAKMQGHLRKEEGNQKKEELIKTSNLSRKT
jgi:hypothetical protein